MFNRHMLVLAREIRGLTQTELAKQAGIDQGNLSRIETGARSPDDATIDKLARALQFPLSFFEREGEPLPPPAWAHHCKVSRWPGGLG